MKEIDEEILQDFLITVTIWNSYLPLKSNIKGIFKYFILICTVICTVKN